MTLTLVPKLEIPTLLSSRALFFDRRLFDEAIKNAYGADIQRPRLVSRGQGR